MTKINKIQLWVGYKNQYSITKCEKKWPLFKHNISFYVSYWSRGHILLPFFFFHIFSSEEKDRNYLETYTSTLPLVTMWRLYPFLQCSLLLISDNSWERCLPFLESSKFLLPIVSINGYITYDLWKSHSKLVSGKACSIRFHLSKGISPWRKRL